MNNNYIEKEELVKEWEKWRDSGDKPETRTISERLGEMIYLIAVKLLTKRHFVRYPQDVKDELAQEGCLKCIKSLKNIDPKKGSVFAYLTMTCWSAFMNYLVRYYKQKNEDRERLIEALQEAKANPTIHTSQFIDEIERQLLDWDKDAREGSGGVFSDGIILNNRK